MAKYLVSILCSSNIRLVKESLNSVLNQENFDDYDIFLIVNTLNDQFYQDIIYEFNKHNYTKLKKIIRTESNGSPGKGHNSVLNTFYRDYKYENLIMLDGDDFLYPYALERIDKVRNIEKSDVIMLYGNTQVKTSHTTFNETNYDTVNNIHNYDLLFKYQIIEYNNITKMHENYNTILATPGRLLYTNRKILSTYAKLYDELMYVYDDFLTFLIMYKERNNPIYNITHLSDPYVYFYNAVNTDSVSYKDNDFCNDNDNKLKKQLIKTYVNDYNVTDISIKPYNTITNDTISTTDLSDFHKQSILKLQNVLPPLIAKKRILFIDYSEWDYNTINKRALGGTEAAIYSISTILAKTHDVSVMTKTTERNTVHPFLHYYPLDKEYIKEIQPNIIIFQGQCPMDKSFFTNINPNVVLWNWIHHDITVSFITNEAINFPFDKYIFVSNWQKNRFIQHFKLNHNKCMVIQNGISPIIKLNELNYLQKEPTLIYCSTPYRGLVIAYHLFQQIKQYIPNIKFKVFSCFSRETDKNKTEYLPITDVSKMRNTELDIYYNSIYQLLINDKNIEFYGSVPQDTLFSHMKSAMVLFYPNTYAETCCTSILEAMAHRCNVISSELGAIPETSNGFASIFNPHLDILHDKISTDEIVKNPIQIQSIPDSYQRQFVENTVDLVNNYYSDYNQQLLTNQQDYIRNCTWEKRAEIIQAQIPSV